MRAAGGSARRGPAGCHLRCPEGAPRSTASAGPGRDRHRVWRLAAAVAGAARRRARASWPWPAPSPASGVRVDRRRRLPERRARLLPPGARRAPRPTAGGGPQERARSYLEVIETVRGRVDSLPPPAEGDRSLERFRAGLTNGRQLHQRRRRGPAAAGLAHPGQRRRRADLRRRPGPGRGARLPARPGLRRDRRPRHPLGAQRRAPSLSRPREGRRARPSREPSVPGSPAHRAQGAVSSPTSSVTSSCGCRLADVDALAAGSRHVGRVGEDDVEAAAAGDHVRLAVADEDGVVVGAGEDRVAAGRRDVDLGAGEDRVVAGAADDDVDARARRTSRRRRRRRPRGRRPGRRGSGRGRLRRRGRRCRAGRGCSRRLRRRTIESSPSPPLRRSRPASPSIASLPVPPRTLSGPSSALTVSLPPIALIRSAWLVPVSTLSVSSPMIVAAEATPTPTASANTAAASAPAFNSRIEFISASSCPGIWCCRSHQTGRRGAAQGTQGLGPTHPGCPTPGCGHENPALLGIYPIDSLWPWTTTGF